jgi:HD-like signal output (HDOD) protein
MPMAAQTIDREAMQAKIRTAFPKPQILAKITQAVSDSRASAASLEQCFQYEPSFTLKLLTLANSPYYQSPERLTTLRAATAFLGFKPVTSLAVHVSINELFNFGGAPSAFSGEELRKHATAVGVCAKMISRRLKLGRAEDFFLLGILHDVGLILEHQFYREAFLAVLGRLQESRARLPQVEQDLLGVDHTVLGQMFCDLWELPPNLGLIVRHHHDPLAAPPAILSQACALYVANEIVKTQKVGFYYPAPAGPDPVVLELLRLSADDLEVLTEDFDQEIQVLDQLPAEKGVLRG